MKTQQRLFFWGSLFLLITCTILCRQLKFVESGPSYWRGHDLEKLLGWKTPPDASAPKLITLDEGLSALEFTPSDQKKSIILNTWQAGGGDPIKVRLKHRSLDPLTSCSGKKADPVIVRVMGIDENNHFIHDRVGHVIAGNSPRSWKVTEGVMPLSKKSRAVQISIIVSGSSGNFQLSDLDIVRVEAAPWFPFLSTLLCLLWAGWIYRAVRPHQSRSLISLLTTIWLLGWGAYLIFPRTIDIPRPFFSRFWMSQKDETTQLPAYYNKADGSQSELQSSGPPPKVERPPTDSVRRWFKSLVGGSFVMHFGVMGVFAGGLLLLLPLRNAWPYLLTMVIGIELLPAILINNAGSDDLIDLATYAVAILVAIPAANKVRSFLPRSLQSRDIC